MTEEHRVPADHTAMTVGDMIQAASNTAWLAHWAAQDERRRREREATPGGSRTRNQDPPAGATRLVSTAAPEGTESEAGSRVGARKAPAASPVPPRLPTRRVAVLTLPGTCPRQPFQMEKLSPRQVAHMRHLSPRRWC